MLNCQFVLFPSLSSVHSVGAPLTLETAAAEPAYFTRLQRHEKCWSSFLAFPFDRILFGLHHEWNHSGVNLCPKYPCRGGKSFPKGGKKTRGVDLWDKGEAWSHMLLIRLKKTKHRISRNYFTKARHHHLVQTHIKTSTTFWYQCTPWIHLSSFHSCRRQRLIEALGGGWVAAYKRLGRAFNCWVSDKDYIVNNRSFDAEREHIFWLPFVLGFQLRFDFKKRTVNICHGGWVSSEIQFDWDLHKLAPTLQPPPHNKRNTYFLSSLYAVLK